MTLKQITKQPITSETYWNKLGFNAFPSSFCFLLPASVSAAACWLPNAEGTFRVCLLYPHSSALCWTGYSPAYLDMAQYTSGRCTSAFLNLWIESDLHKWQGICDSFWFPNPISWQIMCLSKICKFDVHFCKMPELINYFILFMYVDSFCWVQLFLVPAEYLWLCVALRWWFGDYLATYRFLDTAGLWFTQEG